MVIHIAESPEPRDPSSPLLDEPASLGPPRMEQVRRRVRNVSRVIRMKKVCEHCGMTFNKSHQYMQHLRTHRPLQKCDKCNYKTKDLKRFRHHQISHKKENPDVKCNLCNELFATDTSLKIHKKKIHKVYECKYCLKEFDSEDMMLDHMADNHGHIRDKPRYLTAREMKNVKPVNIFLDPPSPNGKGQFICRLCNKETRNKYQLKIHIAQHLGVSSSKISDDFLITQDVEQFNREVGSVSLIGIDGNVADCQENENSDCFFPHPIKSEPGVSGGYSLGKKFDSGLAGRSESSSNSSVTYSPDTSPAATRQDGFPLTVSTDSLDMEIDIDEANPLVPQTVLKEEPLDFYSRPDNWDDVNTDSNAAVKCGVCGIDFPDLGNLHSHVLRMHNKSVFRCGLCELNFPRPEDLYNHAITEHKITSANPQPSYLQSINQCDKRPNKFPISRLSRILPPSKPERVFIKCEVCKETFKSRKTLRKHEKMKHRKVFSCQACGVTHYQSSRMIRHQKFFHKEKLRCRYLCMALFDTEVERSAHHKEVHKKDDSKVTCPYCQVEYQYEGNLINHLDRCKSCPPDKRPAHVCGNCDLMLPSIEEYNVHIKECRPSKREFDKPKTHLEDPNEEKDLVLNVSHNDDTDPLQEANVSRGAAVIKTSLREESSTKESEGNVSTRKSNFMLGLLASTDILSGKGAVTDNKSTIFTRNTRSRIEEGSLSENNVVQANIQVCIQDGPHTCIYCPDIFKDQDIAREHVLACHKHLLTRIITEPQICEVCGMVFKNHLCRCKHTAKHYSDLQMWDNLVPHNILEVVKSRSFCWICKTTLRGKLKNHIEMRNDCIDRILRGMKSENIKRPLHCKLCNDRFNDRLGFWRHIKLHIAALPKVLQKVPTVSCRQRSKKEQPLQCSKCLLHFHDKAELYKHLALHFVKLYKISGNPSHDVSEDESNGNDSDGVHVF